MSQLFYLISGEFIVFLIYHVFTLWTAGWWNSPTLGGSLVLGGLILLNIPLLLIAAFLKRNNQTIRYLKHLSHRIGFPRIQFAALVASILLGILWILTAIIQSPSLHELTPYEAVILFLSLLSGQIWFLPIFWQKPQPVEQLVEIWGPGKVILLLGIVYLASVILKVVFITPLVHSLIVYFDSFQYWQMAYQMYQGTFNIAEFNHYPPLYPLLISSSFSFGLAKSLQTISVINAVLSSISIFPIYLLARQFFGQKFSFFFTLVCTVFPFHLVYPSVLASENLAYPLFFWSVYFTYAGPVKRRNVLLWDLLTALSIGLLWLTRYQTLVLIPVFLISWWVKPESGMIKLEYRPTRRKILRLLLMTGIILLVYAPWAIMGIRNGFSIQQIIGTQIYVHDFPIPRTFNSLVFWIGITLAYMGLMAAPVLTQIIQSGLGISALVRDKVYLRWILFVGLISLMLFITVANHAWRAEYNYPIPNRLLGRYMLTLSVLVWLTALVFYKEGIRTSTWKRVLTGLLAFGLAVICYQVFYNPAWILHKTILYYFFVDGYLPSLIPQYFFMFLIFTIGMTIFWAAIRQIQVGTYFLVGCLAVIFLASIPTLYREIAGKGLPGRHLDEMIHFIQTNPVVAGQAGQKTVWFNPIEEIPLEREFIVRGLSVTENIVKRMSGNPASEYKCKTRLMIQLADKRRFGVIENIDSCTYPEDRWLTHYWVIQNEYAVVELPANK